MSNTLLMPFIDSSEAFVNGFECGQIWEILNEGGEIDSRPCHIENKEQIKMMCDLFSCNYLLEDASEGWTILTVKKTTV